MDEQKPEQIRAGSGAWRERTYEIIFEHHDRAGRLFDIGLLITILFSVVVVMLESVASIRASYLRPLMIAEWTVTVLFSIEYVLRLLCVRSPKRYALSFFGIVDLLSILPAFLNLFFTGAHYLIIVRILRLLRIFRIFKLVQFLTEADELIEALKASRVKITVFLVTVATLVCVMGALMYIVEGEASGFTSIPQGVYWAVVTMTTVGYGDITPESPFGRFIASVLMIFGYGIIAVPTGIVTSHLSFGMQNRSPRRICHACGLRGHGEEANFCRSCGARLREE